jgi:hypothetical protein
MFGSGFRGFGGGSKMEEESEPAKDVDTNGLYELLGNALIRLRGDQNNIMLRDKTSIQEKGTQGPPR